MLPMAFTPRITPNSSESTLPSFLFLFSGSDILIRRSDAHPEIPITADLPGLALRTVYFGSLHGRSCYAAELNGGLPACPSLSMVGLRQLYGRLPDQTYQAAGYGRQVAQWDGDHQYCGRCGRPMQNKADERAKICSGCAAVVFPRISPAVIMAVLRDNRILLARSTRFKKSRMFSVLAGYVEVGETLEACVRREVKEEVDIDVRNIRYFGSQPWHYSSALMVGFTAEYAGGEIAPDLTEIAEAGWFTADDLPDIPGWGSIARQLIDWFAERGRNKRKGSR